VRSRQCHACGWETRSCLCRRVLLVCLKPDSAPAATEDGSTIVVLAGVSPVAIPDEGDADESEVSMASRIAPFVRNLTYSRRPNKYHSRISRTSSISADKYPRHPCCLPSVGVPKRVGKSTPPADELIHREFCINNTRQDILFLREEGTGKNTRRLLKNAHQTMAWMARN